MQANRVVEHLDITIFQNCGGRVVSGISEYNH